MKPSLNERAFLRQALRAFHQETGLDLHPTVESEVMPCSDGLILELGDTGILYSVELKRWAQQAKVFSPYLHYDNTDELRASGAYRVYTPEEVIASAREMVDAQPIMLHPLCGGIHPDLAWESVKLFAAEAMPGLREEGIIR
mgnify:CR=1 FL=1